MVGWKERLIDGKGATFGLLIHDTGGLVVLAILQIVRLGVGRRQPAPIKGGTVQRLLGGQFLTHQHSRPMHIPLRWLVRRLNSISDTHAAINKRGWIKALVVRRVDGKGPAQRGKVGRALNLQCPRFGRAKRRQQHRSQHADDGDDNEQFDQGKRAPPVASQSRGILIVGLFHVRRSSFPQFGGRHIPAVR